MAKVTAKSKYLRGSAQKVRRVINVIRGQKATYAMDMLKFMPHRAAGYVYQTLKSAVANAEHNHNLDPESLQIVEIYANEAPTFRRGRAESKGRYRSIMKRNAHITVVLSDELEAKSEVKEEKKPGKKAATKKTEKSAAKKPAKKTTTKPKAKKAENEK